MNFLYYCNSCKLLNLENHCDTCKNNNLQKSKAIAIKLKWAFDSEEPQIEIKKLIDLEEEEYEN